MTTEQRELMSPQDLADYAQVPVATIYAWRYKGEGPPGIKVGRHLRFRRRDVESWLDQQRGPEKG